MYNLIKHTHPRARRDYQCIWCGQQIESGLQHVHEISSYCEQFQNHRWHMECADSAYRAYCDGLREFFAFVNDRPFIFFGENI